MQYDEKLCMERHTTVNRRLERVEKEGGNIHGRIDDVITAVNGKFTKLFYAFIGVLITSLGGTIGIIITVILRTK